ncbi:fast leu-rich domain-containing [Holotrichia oblita]|uniref:Fast leu-rich domain-containing n=1 Tax=Holotrichia oblita TaxID=644536 RepID=A0ACB9SH42_HOLOL|nr:fast leu-rich domain-containing [Holotrichia oblita]
MFKNLTKFLCDTVLKTNKLNLTAKQIHNIKKFNTFNVYNLNNTTIKNHRFLHIISTKYAKNFVETENIYARKVLDSFPITSDLVEETLQRSETFIRNEDDFNKLLDQNWRVAPPSHIIRAFLNIIDYCRENNINISDTRFDKLVDGLMDNVERLTTSELYTMLRCLNELPQTECYTSHNYHDVWSALDDMCTWKLRHWDIETLFKFANIFQQLHLGRIGDYIFRFIDRISRKPGKLTQNQLVHLFFYMNVCRKRSIEFEFEAAIASKLDSLTVDEIAIIAMGFFKSQTKIKLATILNRMLELVIENSGSIHEISLAAILKIVRLSQHAQTKDNIIRMFDKITGEIPRLSHLCATHVALTGTSLQIFHAPILKAVGQKTIDNISDTKMVRLKDIERVLLAMTMFDFDPETKPDFYKTIYEELHRDERIPERILYPKSLPSALMYLSIRNIYSVELMNQLLKPEFTFETYGKHNKMHPRELFSLNYSTEIDLPHYTGSKWTTDMKIKSCRWLIETLPENVKSKTSATDKMIIDVISTLIRVVGSKELLYIGHVLPNYAKSDIILCLNKETNKFIEPSLLNSYQLHQIKYPEDCDKYKWYCFMVISLNLTARNTYQPVGIANMKRRHLKAIGYEPILVKMIELNRIIIIKTN